MIVVMAFFLFIVIVSVYVLEKKKIVSTGLGLTKPFTRLYHLNSPTAAPQLLQIHSTTVE